MGLKDDLQAEVSGIFRKSWGDIPTGRVVPDPEDLLLGNDGRTLKATVLYADLVGSTKLVDESTPTFAAEVYKSFLTCAARIIKAEGGAITAYDGDRIMAVYIGGTPNTDAIRSGLKLNWAVANIVRPALNQTYARETYVVKHVVGIDTSDVLVSRIGVRNDNDLVWVGRAANHAAKLCDLRLGDYTTWISADVYSHANESGRIGSNGANMWVPHTWKTMGDRQIYASNWSWSVA